MALIIFVMKKIPRNHKAKGGDISIKKFYADIIYKTDSLPDEVQEIMDSRVEADIVKAFGQQNEDSAEYDTTNCSRRQGPN